MSTSRGSLLSLLLLCGCASTGTDAVPSRPPAPIEPAPIYLIAARQKPRVERSLRAAGIPLTDDLPQAVYLLRVTIGNEKGWRSCGTVNNVKYALRKDNRDVLVLSGSGPTGECTPSVFDDLSARLRNSFAGAAPLDPQPEEEDH